MLIKVLKKIQRLEISTKNKVDSIFAGNYKSAFLGRGIEFADIRPYTFNDDIRDIDWKTTSKQGKVFVKKYQETRDNNLYFIFDFNPAIYFQTEKEEKFQKILEVFGILAFTAIKNGDNVGAIFTGLKKNKVFKAKKGRKNVLEILNQAIVEYQKKDLRGEKDYSKDFDFIQKILKRSSVVFWLSGYLPELKKEKELQKKWKSLKIKNDFIPVIVSDKFEKELVLVEDIVENLKILNPFKNEVQEYILDSKMIEEYKKEYQKREGDFVSFFRKNRMDVIFIENEEDIFRKLFIFFKRRQKHLI